MRAFRDYAFNYLKVHRIEVRVAVGNIRSRTIPKIPGFKEEGRKREAECSIIVMSIKLVLG